MITELTNNNTCSLIRTNYWMCYKNKPLHFQVLDRPTSSLHVSTCCIDFSDEYVRPNFRKMMQRKPCSNVSWSVLKARSERYWSRATHVLFFGCHSQRQSPAMRSNAEMTDRQGDVKLRFAHVSAPNLALWLGHSFREPRNLIDIVASFCSLYPTPLGTTRF
jgi:hypothetical protein